MNDDPTFTSSSTGAYVTDEDTPLTAAFPTVTDVDNDTPTFTVTGSGPANGSVTVSGGDFTYTPNANYNGTDSFSFTASDGNGGVIAGTVSITVNAVNDPPVAVNDEFELTIALASTGTYAMGALLTNDTDLEGDSLTAVAQSNVSTTQGGLVTINSDGTFVYTPPAASFTGDDAFSCSISDGNGGTATAQAKITVHSPTSPNVIIYSIAPVDEGGIATISATVLGYSNSPMHYSITWGDGSAVETGIYYAGTPLVLTHKYLDDDPTATPSDNCEVSLTATDAYQQVHTASAYVTVVNVAPTIELDEYEPEVFEGDGLFTISGKVTDKGTSDTITVRVTGSNGYAKEFYLEPNERFSFTVDFDDDDLTLDDSDDSDRTNFAFTITAEDDECARNRGDCIHPLELVACSAVDFANCLSRCRENETSTTCRPQAPPCRSGKSSSIFNTDACMLLVRFSDRL